MKAGILTPLLLFGLSAHAQIAVQFAGKGNPHYTHADYQGSVIAVTDSVGTVVQTANYYPYGEPWREPTGQLMLFAGKERTSNSDYRFDPRSYVAAGLFWTAPDQLAGQFRHLSPYSDCAGNPIFFSDPTGRVLEIANSISMEGLLSYLWNLQSLTDDRVSISMNVDKNNNRSHTVNLHGVDNPRRQTGTHLLRDIVDSEKTITLDYNNSSGNRLFRTNPTGATRNSNPDKSGRADGFINLS